MIGLFTKKAGEAARQRRGRAAVAVESLEGRSLMAGGFAGASLANTLNARDAINLHELSVVQGIEQLKVAETGNLQHVIFDGNARSNALYGQYLTTLAQEQAAAAAGNVGAVGALRVLEHQLLASISQVRSLMRQATVLDNVTEKQLGIDSSRVVATFNNTQNNLSRGNDPNLTYPHAIAALDAIGLQAQQHAAAATARLAAIDAAINGPLFLPVGG